MNTVLSTQEIASLLQVTETTVKRWANEGRIVCSKTLGGHRKFNSKDVIEFAEANGYSISGLLPPPMSIEQLEQLQIGLAMRNYPKIADALLRETLRSDREGIIMLLLHLLKHHITFHTITDEIIRPALVKVGEMWEKGEISIHQEHIASEAITEALIRISPEVYHKPPNGLTAAFACVEGELHDIGLRCLAYSFESDGWLIHYIGPNTPIVSIISFVKISRPNLVALSATMNPKEEKTMNDLRSISKEIHAYGGRLIIGGSNLGSLSEEELGCDLIVNTASESIEYARETFQLGRSPKRRKKGEDI